MKRLICLLLFLFPVLSAYPISTGISVFLPSEAPLSFEEHVSYRLYLDKLNLYSIPLSLIHNQVYGLSLEDRSLATQAWFYTSSLELEAMFEAHIPVRIFHLALFAGPSITWHYLRKDITANIQSDIASSQGYDAVSINSSSISGGWGLGATAGLGFGLKFNKFTWQLDIAYHWSRSSLGYTADYHYINGVTTGSSSIDLSDSALIMKGFKIRFSVDVPLI